MKKALNHIKPYNDVVIFYGIELSRRLHTNHAIKIILSKDLMAVVCEGRIYRAKGVIVKSDTAHKVKPNEGISTSIYIDPETETGKLIARLFRNKKILKLEDERADNLFYFFNHVLENHITEPEVKNGLLKRLLDSDSLATYPAIDERIERIIFQIKTGSNPTVKFSELVRLCGLSESRLIHLFKKEIGIPIRRYVLWCKTKKAIMSMASGASIKQSANLAGFTDAAHFNRTFVSMFGLAPSSMLK